MLKVKALKYEDVFDNVDKLSNKLSAGGIDAVTTALTADGISITETNSILYSPTQVNQSIFYNNIYLIVVPRFGDNISDSLRTQIDNFLSTYKMITLNYVYLDPTYIDINCTARYIKSTATEKSNTEIEMDIQKIITDYFLKENRDLGELLLHSTLVESLNAIDGITSIIFEWNKDSDAPSVESNANIQMGGLEFPRLKTSTVVTS